tara:strand:- start:137 stop:631 length:495 start_codon:yes stop_codon:yes gene_type:complete
MSENNKNIAYAKAKSVKTSLNKVNLVLRMIRGKKAENALNILSFSKKRISIEVTKVLKSAIANAENNHQLDIDKLFVKEATVGKSMVLKRFRPRARGRTGKILKPFSKIKILVAEKETVNNDKSLENQNIKENNKVENSKNKEVKKNENEDKNKLEEDKNGTKN